MAYSTIYFDKVDHLLCVTDGKVSSLDEYIRWGMELVGKSREARHSLLLVDNRTFHLDLIPADASAFVDSLEKMGVFASDLRLAVLSCPQNPVMSSKVEEALLERSVAISFFKCQADAMRWLMP